MVICLVNGWAAGGHSLHVVCSLTLASREYARFKQTDTDVGSFDKRLRRRGSAKFAARSSSLVRTYTYRQMHQMGAVNAVAEHAELGDSGAAVGGRINIAPRAQRMLKFAFSLPTTGWWSALFAGEAHRLAT